MRGIILLFLVSSCYFNCGNPANPDSFFDAEEYVGQPANPDSFFDLKKYMTEEKERLVENKVKLEKTITLNGVAETKTIETPDYEVEFSEFVSSDINRPAWLDKYDEIKKGNNIHYRVKDNGLEVKTMDVFGTDPVRSISVGKKTQNILNNSQKELSYSKDGYKIKSVRKSIGESADTLIIAVKFLD